MRLVRSPKKAAGGFLPGSLASLALSEGCLAKGSPGKRGSFLCVCPWGQPPSSSSHRLLVTAAKVVGLREMGLASTARARGPSLVSLLPCVRTWEKLLQQPPPHPSCCMLQEQALLFFLLRLKLSVSNFLSSEERAPSFFLLNKSYEIMDDDGG